MNLLAPGFLWALLALALPLLIHLFNFRRYKKVYFAHTGFLRQVEQHTRSINRLRQWIILLLRMLALAALVIAFARPFLPPEAAGGKAPRYFSLYIDNSYSMQLEGGQGPLINTARSRAAQIIKSLPQNSQVQVLTNDFTARNQRFYSPGTALDLVDEIQISSAFRTGRAIRNRLLASRQNVQSLDTARLELFLLSDLQRSSLASLLAEDLPEQWSWQLLPFQPANAPGNLALDSLWTESPVSQAGFEQQFQVRLHNYDSSAAENISLQMLVNDDLASTAEITVPALSEATATLYYTPPRQGAYRGKVELQGEGVDFDNNLFFSFSTQNPAKVISVGFPDELSLFDKLYGRDSLFQYSAQPFENVRYDAIPAADLVLVRLLKSPSSGFRNALQKNLKRGGNVMLIPGPDEGVVKEWLASFGLGQAQLSLDTQRAKTIHYQDPFFRGVFEKEQENPDLPQVNQYYRWESSGSAPLLSLENGDPLISHQPQGEGELFLSAVDLSAPFSQFYRHPIAVPILINAGLFSKGQQRLYLRSGKSDAFQEISAPLKKDEPLSIQVDGENQIPPQRHTQGNYRLYLPPENLKPGQYPVSRDSSRHGYLSVNLDARESDLTYLKRSDWETKEGYKEQNYWDASSKASLAGQLERQFRGVPLWPWFLGLAIFFLLAEMALIKWWRS